MRYYSKKLFYFFFIIHTLAAFALFLYWQASSVFLCWTLSGADCLHAKTELNIFIGIIPLLFIMLSQLLIIFQQYKNKRIGYLMGFLAFVPISYFIYLQTKWNILVNIGNMLFSTPPLFLAFYFIILLTALVPFYVLGKLIKTDFFRK